MQFHKILVTGADGFIGSHLTEFLAARAGDERRVLNLDLLTYAGSLDNLTCCNRYPRHRLVHGDIRDAALLTRLFSRYRIDAVFHLAAESHVDNSLNDPGRFVDVNTRGTCLLLEAARRAWLGARPYKADPVACPGRFVMVSTDEVYGSAGMDDCFSERAPLFPGSPYAASKAGADMLCRAYANSYGLDVVIPRSANNYGPRQHQEKLIPRLLDAALKEEPLPIYGDGLQRRSWLHVADHCTALWTVFNKGLSGQIYNVGAGAAGEIDNLSLARHLCALLDCRRPRARGGSYAELITHVADRPGHDRRYALDCSRLKALGWEPRVSFAKGLEATVAWYEKRYMQRKGAPAAPAGGAGETKEHERA